MVRPETLRGFVLLLSTLPISMANSFAAFPGVVRGDVTGSPAMEWALQSEPERDDAVGFTFNSVDVFRYIPYTGAIPPRVSEGPDGNVPFANYSYDPRLSIYNTSTRGIGFRIAGLSLEDAGNYTCRCETLSSPITMDAVLFVYGNMEPDHSAAVYVNAGLARDTGKSTEELISGRERSIGNQPADTNAAYEDMNLTGSNEQVHPADIEPEDSSDYMPMSSTGNLTYQRAGRVCQSVYQRNREPTHPTDVVREDGLGSVPVTSAEPRPPVIGGVYESVDQRTREPVRPADTVHAALSDTPRDL